MFFILLGDLVDNVKQLATKLGWAKELEQSIIQWESEFEVSRLSELIDESI